MKQIPDDIQQLLKAVFDDCQKEDVAVRERQIRLWRRLKLLWEGYQRVWYSEVAHDWRIWDETKDEDADQAYYDKPINVYKAYLESIIAALSVLVPPIKCYPDDADNTLDLATARAGDKIGQLIYRHNNVPLLWLHSLFVFFTEGMTACYSYPKESKDYGTYEEKEHDEVEENHQVTICPNCGHTLDDSILPDNQPTQQSVQQNPTIQLGMQGQNQQLSQQQNPKSQQNQSQPTQKDESERLENQIKDEFMPGDDDSELHYKIDRGKDLCPACMALIDPEIKTEKFIVTRLVGITTKPKSRMCMEVYGGLYVKIPNYAKSQEDVPYLIFSREVDYSMAVEKFEHLHGNKYLIDKIKSGNNPGSYSQYAQWGRLSPQYQGEYPTSVVTIHDAWIRPAKFNILSNKEDIQKLKKRYPEGVKITYVNDEFGTAEQESLDDCWTLTKNPLADYLHFDPLGQSLESIQEIVNDLISLTIQTIEHGIGQTFADPAVLSFRNYEQTEVIPGGIFPAKPSSGKSLQDGFHELKTATLSPEVAPFTQNIQSLGQIVSGALPSIFGGAIEGSNTASEYSMSRAQALQRLQNTWKIITMWWKEIFGKIIPMYIKEVKDDERDVQRDDDGNFVNVLIRKAELEGKIGKVELEANENLPITWSQKKDLMIKLMEATNPDIVKILNAPENIAQIHEALGLVDFYVPGEDDIIKQYDEIKLLLNSEPIQTGDPQNPEVPSVDIDPIFDNSSIEFEICRKWIISEAGRQCKMDNEAGYRNVLLHGKMHFQQVQQQQNQPAPPEQPKVAFSFKGPDLVDPQIRAVFDKVEQLPPPTMQDKASPNGSGAIPNAKPNPKNQEAPILGESNVSTQ